MSRITRSALALGAVFFAFTIAACGGSDVPDGDVAKVGDYTISQNAFDRWFKLASASSGATTPKRSDYLKQCNAEYDQLKQQVMTFLVRSTWLEAEAARQGVKISDAEA